MLASTLLSVASLAAVSNALPQWGPSINGSCNTSQQLCCDNISNVAQKNGFLCNTDFPFSVFPEFYFGQAGIECSSVTGIGGGDSGGSCAQQPVCCQNINMNELVGVGCSPVNVVG